MPYQSGHQPGNEPSPMAAGLRGRCPRCGEGHMFDGFLALQNSCDNCGLDYDFADSADGPAVFIMFIGRVRGRRPGHVGGVHVHATYLVASGDVVLADDRARSGAGATAEGDHDRLAIPPPCRGRAPRGVNTSMSKKEAARTGQARERVAVRAVEPRADRGRDRHRHLARHPDQSRQTGRCSGSPGRKG